jgi:hypothetical protein
MGDTNESGAEQLVIQLKSDWTTKQVKLEENINPRYRSQVKCDLNLGQDYSLHTEIGFKQVGKRANKQPVVVVGHCGSAKTQLWHPYTHIHPVAITPLVILATHCTRYPAVPPGFLRGSRLPSGKTHGRIGVVCTTETYGHA